MKICIVIYLKTVFVNTNTYLNNVWIVYLIYKSLMSWNVSNILFISVTVRHKNVQSNVPVGRIIISLYCWHSKVNKSFEIKIGSQQNVNFFKKIYFKEIPSTGSLTPRQLSWKPYFNFSHIWILHMKKSRMLLIYTM